MHLEFKDESSSNSSSDTSSSSESEDEGDKDKPIKESVTDKAEKEKVRKEELKRQVGPKNHLFLSDCLFGNKKSSISRRQIIDPFNWSILYSLLFLPATPPSYSWAFEGFLRWHNDSSAQAHRLLDRRQKAHRFPKNLLKPTDANIECVLIENTFLTMILESKKPTERIEFVTRPGNDRGRNARGAREELRPEKTVVAQNQRLKKRTKRKQRIKTVCRA